VLIVRRVWKRRRWRHGQNRPHVWPQIGPRSTGQREGTDGGRPARERGRLMRAATDDVPR
jgi:hypothetical protein